MNVVDTDFFEFKFKFLIFRTKIFLKSENFINFLGCQKATGYGGEFKSKARHAKSEKAFIITS